ncbi:glycoside hydrolase family 47 protein [Lepidopterella palustris CBS 459.81]|uniref:alpha-1,2-Mannosidase n=1 Tax=Lepidopterella palustris CBS 459.81 TaxID=1314670 RepID=A0A8E2JDE2_9PEZI|nr:glycoside hydrolase family 47 protein [Lepidopterella palustris CBS 459.81]
MLVLALTAIPGIVYLSSCWTQPINLDNGGLDRYMNEFKIKVEHRSQNSFDWHNAPVHNQLNAFTHLPNGTSLTIPRVQYHFTSESKTRAAQRETRRQAVKDVFIKCWTSYEKYAWGSDELKPYTKVPIDTSWGWGVTLIDSLDTLYIMGLKTQYEKAVAEVAKIDVGKTPSVTLSVFETTIRILGGLISAYDLSHDETLLEKATNVGDMLYMAFDTPNRMPVDRLPFEEAKLGGGFIADQRISLAGIGSLTMEFVRLSQLTTDSKYYDAVARITDMLDANQDNTTLPGMFPTWINANATDLSEATSYTLGAEADSVYEYFPKAFALLGGQEPVYRKLYERSMEVVENHMLFRPMLPGGEDVLISGDVKVLGGKPVLDPEGQHLTCFAGGMFALAGRLFDYKHHVDIGAKLTKGCVYTYKAMPSGIMPEIFDMVACESQKSCPWNQTKWEADVIQRSYPVYSDDALRAAKKERLPKGFTAIKDRRYLLRPEAIESVFILYRITGDSWYQDAAWDMFTAIQERTATEHANSGIPDVTLGKDEFPPSSDSMESFWLAETLKYFYLVFSPPDLISLDDFVLNTEAHPFRRPK